MGKKMKGEAYGYIVYSDIPVCGSGRAYEDEQRRRKETKMRRIIYWLQRKKRIKEKRCGQCCLTCPYYRECSGDFKVPFEG